MLAIYKRELRSYFTTPLGYVYLAVFLAASAFAFCYTTLQAATSKVETYFTVLLFMQIVIMPLLTMRLFSEEKKLKTEQLLLTAPIRTSDMVAAKFLAALTVFVGAVLLTASYTIPLYIYSTPVEITEKGVVLQRIFPFASIFFGSAVAIILVGAAFIAIGMFVSSLTENQLASAVVTVGALLLLLVISFANTYIDSYAVRSVLSWISIFSRYRNFTYGVFDFVALIYYASVCFIFCFFTVRVYDRRRVGA